MVKWRTVSLLISSIGLGVFLHDRVGEWATLGQRLHGIDVGFVLSYLPLLLWTLNEELRRAAKYFRAFLNPDAKASKSEA